MQKEITMIKLKIPVNKTTEELVFISNDGMVNIEKYEGFVKSFVQETFHKDLILETFTKAHPKAKKFENICDIAPISLEFAEQQRKTKSSA